MAAGGSGNQQGGQGGPNAGGPKGRDTGDARRDDDRIANRGLEAGYTGNRYPGYRGPTGTRNPKAKPEAAPGPSRFSPGDKPRPSIWDRVFQPRRTKNPTPSYKATRHNLEILAGLTPGPMMAGKVAAMAAGLGPQFKDYTGMVQGPGDYDPKNAPQITGRTQLFDGVTVPRLLYSRGARPPRY
jgi:hypothetical protein